MPGDDCDNQVVVMILRVAKYESRANLIASKFRGKHFDIHYVDCSHVEALKKAKKYSETSHCIIVADNMITTMSRGDIKDIVIKMTNTEYDFFYLHRYNDKCQQSTSISSLCEETVQLVRTTSPHGDDCLMFSPKGRDMILDQEIRCRSNLGRALRKAIKNGDIEAIATSPCIFDFDIANATDNDQYEKRCECERVQLLGTPLDDEESPGRLLLLIIAFFVILAVAWALLYVGPKD